MPKRKAESKPGPEDTQEMFAAGQDPPDDPEETREYEVATAVDDPRAETAESEPDTDEEEAGEDALGQVEEAPEGIDDEDLEEIEDEAWEGDEDEEWEEDEAGPEPVEPDPDSGDRKDLPGSLQASIIAAGQRVGRGWNGFWARIGAVKLPRHEIDGQKVLAVAGILAIAVLVGTGGYLIGKRSGDDLDRARLEGEFAGKRAGAVEGATRGYASGFKRGRDLAFRKSYSASYKRNYIRAYNKAGMDAPKPQDIEVPKP